jgi:hypothetical protein
MLATCFFLNSRLKFELFKDEDDADRWVPDVTIF